MSKWRVDLNKAPINKEVLAFAPCRGVFVAYTDYYNNSTSFITVEGEKEYTTTHWMELPEEPEKEQ